MSTYVPDENALGNPGIFGFLKGAVSTVGKVLTGQTTIKIPRLPQPVVNVQLPPGAVPQLPPWALPVGIGLAAILILPRLMGGGRR